MRRLVVKIAWRVGPPSGSGLPRHAEASEHSRVGDGVGFFTGSRKLRPADLGHVQSLGSHELANSSALSSASIS